MYLSLISLEKGVSFVHAQILYCSYRVMAGTWNWECSTTLHQFIKKLEVITHLSRLQGQPLHKKCGRKVR